MNLEPELKRASSPSYTDELIDRLRNLTESLQNSSYQIYEKLDKLVGEDDFVVESANTEVSSINENGMYGTLHMIMDELERAIKLNKDNNLKLDRIV